MLWLIDMSDDRDGQTGSFRVTIYYREPTYELVVGEKPEPYKWVYTITAPSEREAETEALRQFHEIARLSSVSWVRLVVGIETRPASAAANQVTA